MSELPDYFEMIKERGATSYQPYTFEYNHTEGVFVVAGTQVEPEDFDPYTFEPVSLNLEDRALDIDEAIKEPLLIDLLGNLVATPKLHNWAQQNRDVVTSETPKLMREVFESLSEVPEDFQDELPGMMGFETIFRSEGNGLRLQVFGSCACFEPNLYGMLRGYEHGFAEYGLHNADSQVQRIALYAGLGSIAASVKD